MYVDGTFKDSVPDPGDLPFFDSDENDEDDDDNDDDHLILKDELLGHLTQVNPIVFTLNQWYHCTKIHSSKFSNPGVFSHSTTLKVKLHLPCGWAKIAIINGPRKLLLFIFNIEVLILLQLISIKYFS